MPMYLSTPPAIMGNEKEQLNQLRSYVFQTVEALNIGMKDMSRGCTGRNKRSCYGGGE